jgi:myo-inositol-1(or 4)-monophosphatase
MNEKLVEVMKRAALTAGAYMKGSDERDHTEKSDVKDFVTVADIKAQNILKEELQKDFPDVVILSEEDSEEDRALLFQENFTGFVLDPIDGTYNFKHDMKESAISIGYVEDGKSLAGVIYDPYKDELYEATKGSGAFCNGQQISVSNQTDLAAASVATSNSYDAAGMVRNLKRHLAIHETAGIMPWTSCPGSGVLIMAWIAAGRIDAYHHNGLKPWDNAAAFLLVMEAGGLVETLSGNDARFTSATVLMGTPIIVDRLKTIFTQIDQSLLT